MSEKTYVVRGTIVTGRDKETGEQIKHSGEVTAKQLGLSDSVIAGMVKNGTLALKVASDSKAKK